MNSIRPWNIQNGEKAIPSREGRKKRKTRDFRNENKRSQVTFISRIKFTKSFLFFSSPEFWLRRSLMYFRCNFLWIFFSRFWKPMTVVENQICDAFPVTVRHSDVWSVNLDTNSRRFNCFWPEKKSLNMVSIKLM